MPGCHCRIGKVRPRLSLYRDDKVYEPDFVDETGFIESMIGAVRHVGVRGYSVVVTHDDGSVTCGSKGRAKFRFSDDRRDGLRAGAHDRPGAGRAGLTKACRLH